MDELHEGWEGMGADDHVDPRRPSLDQRLVFLSQASRDHDPHPRIPFLERFQVAQRPVQAVVRVLSDSARVEDDDI